MSKRPQRGNTCQQQQQQQSERHEGPPANVGHRELGQAPGISENLDDHKQAMTSQTRKRPRLSQLEGGLPSAHATGERRNEESKTLVEQQEMIEPAKGELVQELRVSGRARCRTQQQHTKANQPVLARSPPAQRPGPDSAGGEQPEAGRRQSPRPLTAANPAGPEQNICAACKRPIRERYLLMALDKHWHEDCLKCACCDCRLGEVGSSLFTHSDKILCRRDFLRIFGQHGHCAACKRSIPPYELVMRANELAYHMDCFACQQCQYRFCVGDRFYLAEAHKITCLRCHSEQPPATPTATASAATSKQPTSITTSSTTTTNSHFTYDQNQDQKHLQREPKGAATSTTSGGGGRLEAPPELPGDAFEGREHVETAKPAVGANQLDGERKLTPSQQQQQQVALQPGDQKQACAV